MIRRFKIENNIARIVDKPTLLRLFTYLDREDITTPVLLIDKNRLVENVRMMGANIENCKLFYAVKANPDIEVLKILDQMGAGFEVASIGELNMLARLNVDPHRIISSNPVKSFDFIRFSASYGVTYLAFDSLSEIEKLAHYHPGCNVYIRLSVPNEGSEWPLSKKFGLELEESLTLLLKAREKGLNPVGITFHVGSQCNNIYNWNIAIDKASLLWNMAKEAGLKLTLLNLGGGYPVKYTKSVLQVNTIEININRAIREKFKSKIDITIEPGRAIVGEAGVLVSRVIGKATRGDENWLYIDAGVFNGLMESVGGIRYSYITEAKENRRARKSWVLAGPSCDSFDVIDNNVKIYEPDVGDMMLILSAGAYTTSYASEFNGFPIPKTVII